MNIFVKLNNVRNNERFIEIHKQRKEIKNNKAVYDFEYNSENEIFVITEVTDHLVLLYTLRWIDDILDHFYRDELDFEFSWSVSPKLEDVLESNAEEGTVRLFNMNKEIIDSIKYLSLVNVINESEEFIDIKFDYYSGLEYTETINLETTRGVSKFQVARTKDLKMLYSIFWLGEIENIENVRVHYQCETSEVFGSTHCDCREQKDNFMDEMFKRKEGMFIYAHEEGRGMGLYNKNKAYFLTEHQNLDTKSAMEQVVGTSELRNFEIPADIIQQKGITKVNLWTNNPRKIIPFKARGIKVEREEVWYIPGGKKAEKYMQDKKDFLGHMEK